MNKFKWVMSAWMLGSLAAVSVQAAPADAPPAQVKDAVLADDVITSHYKVVDVDAAKHQLTLQADGFTFKVRVRPSVSLAAVKKGEMLDVSLLVREVKALLKPGGVRKSEETVVTAPDGTLEGLRLDSVYKVWAVDKASGRVRLQDANDQFGWLNVHDTAALADAKVGDQVRVILDVVEVADLRAKR